MTNLYGFDIIIKLSARAALLRQQANLENDTEKRKESHSESMETLTGKKRNSQILRE